MIRLLLAVMFIGIVCTPCEGNIMEYDLDVFPKSLPPPPAFDTSYNKYIPRNIWIAVKDRNDDLAGHLKDFFKRNDQWKVNVCDNQCKDEFMNATFPDTSLLWAYHTINPLVGAARADLWRYAVLYMNGGLYLDDDSDIKVPLDEIITPTDRLIMSEEGSSSLGDCYIPTYHLSDNATFTKFTNYSGAKHFNGLDKENVPIFFHGNTLINWAIMVAPRHPVFERALMNAVELIKSEYTRRSYVFMTQWDKKWKHVMCTTGFTLTYTVRELELENSMSPELLPRISVNNFREYKGNVKAYWTGADQSHYMKAMEKPKGLKLLKSYGPIRIDLILRHLEGKTVMGDGKSIWFIKNGTKCGFNSYQTYLDIKFSEKSPRHVSDSILELIPDGEVVSDPQQVYDVINAVHAARQDKAREHAVAIKRQHKEGNHPTSGSSSSDTSNRIEGNTAASPTYRFLRNATNYLNTIKVDCYGDDYAGTRDEYLAGTFSNVLGSNPVLVYPFCARTFQLGNTIGYYLNDIACADMTGAHFVAVHKEFKLISKETLAAKNEQDQLTFFNALPEIIEHPNVLPSDEVKKKMKQDCQCLQYCWESTWAPWIKRVPLVGGIVRNAADAYVQAVGGIGISTVLNNVTDKTTAFAWDKLKPEENQPFLPLYPNVTVQYRCGDNIGFGKTRYGLMPFRAFTYERIPKSSKYIYIVADSPTRNPNAAIWSSRCELILDRLFNFLKSRYPASVIALKRGGDAFLDYARIVHSQVVVCSASTFCLWPSLGNEGGTVHFPLTPLVAGAGSNESAPDLAPHFNWIREVEQLKDFKRYRPWTQVLDDLEEGTK